MYTSDCDQVPCARESVCHGAVISGPVIRHTGILVDGIKVTLQPLHAIVVGTNRVELTGVLAIALEQHEVNGGQCRFMIQLIESLEIIPGFLTSPEELQSLAVRNQLESHSWEGRVEASSLNGGEREEVCKDVGP
jgi:hypothetical protein